VPPFINHSKEFISLKMRWFNYIGLFGRDDYELFLATVELNSKDYESIIDTGAQQFSDDNDVTLPVSTIYLMFLAARVLGHLTPRNDKTYSLNFPSQIHVVRVG